MKWEKDQDFCICWVNILPYVMCWEKYSEVLWLCLMFKHGKEMGYIEKSMTTFREDINTYRSHGDLHFFSYEIRNFHLMASPPFLREVKFNLYRWPWSLDWLQHVMSSSLSGNIRGNVEKKSSWRLGTCSSQSLTMLEKLLVIEHETDLASVQLQMPVNNVKQAASFHLAWRMQTASESWHLGSSTTTMHVEPLPRPWSLLHCHCYAEEVLTTKNEFFLLFFWLVDRWINYSHRSNDSS